MILYLYPTLRDEALVKPEARTVAKTTDTPKPSVTRWRDGSGAFTQRGGSS